MAKSTVKKNETQVVNKGRQPAAGKKKPSTAKGKATKGATKKPHPTKSRTVKSGTRPPKITGADYNRMYKAYCEIQTVKHVADTVGCTYDTAKFYVNGPAKPEYEMPPIRERYARAERAKQSAEDDAEGERLAHRMRLVSAIVNMVEGETVAYQQDLSVRLDQYKKELEDWNNADPKERGKPPRPLGRMSLVAVSKVIDKMVRAEQFLRGGPDQITGVAGTQRFEKYSDAELEELSRTGRIPDHDRNANNFQN